MDLESILFGYVPLIIAFVVIVYEIRSLLSNPTPLNSGIGFFVLGFNAFGIYLLILMLRGAWPNYLPQLAIGLGTLLFFIQSGLIKK
jgi:hypothetical protein